MTKAIVIHTPGGPEVMKWEAVTLPPPGEGEVLIRHTAIGLNYIDVYYRTGLYPAPSPFTPGMEASGVVVKCGPGVSLFKEGERVAYALGPLGAYSQERVIHEKYLMKLPDEISDQLAAGLMVKGLTAHYLVRRTFMLNKNHTILVHAAAGGVGLLLCQWAKYLGARVIGTVSSPEKAELAKQNGCEFPIIYKSENVVERVKEITGGRGVNVVYDSVGKDTFMDSLDCLMRFGMMVSYGQASGPIPPFDIGLLARKGSLFLTRPSLAHYKEDTQEYIVSCAEMFDLVLSGDLRIHIRQSYYLHDAPAAHRDLESRKTEGSTILIPE